MNFSLKTTMEFDGAMKDIFRSNRSLFAYVHRDSCGPKKDDPVYFTFVITNLLKLDKIKNILNIEKEMGSVFTVEWKL